MGDIVESKIGETIKDLLHANLGKLAVWQGIQNELDLLISDIPTFANENNKNKLVNSLKVVMTFLKEHGISEEHLEFLQEEIDRYNNITQISIYEEKDDQLSPEIIEKYAQLGFGQEGIIGLNEPFTFPQLNRLVNGVYEQTKLVKFYISAEKTVRGKIVAEIFEQAQKIPIAMLVKSNKTKEENEDTPAYTKIYLFGSRHDNRKETILKEIEIPLYIYRFTTDSNQDLILLSAHKMEIGEFIVTGVETQCTDNKNLTSTSKLTTKLPFLFVHHAVNRIIHFKGPDDFKNFRENLPGSNEEFFDYPFTTTLRHEKTGSIKQCILNHPTWYKWLVWSWLLHEKKGLFNKYPLHVFQIAAQHSGKSLMLNALHTKTSEHKQVFSGSSSRLLYLVPSFKYNPPQIGYLAESNRFAFCDEFLRCLTSTVQMEDSKIDERLAMLNDLLEHQKREAGSGVSRLSVNMTSRVFAASNPIKGMKTCADLLGVVDNSFLSRWLIYFQSPQHIDMIRQSKDEKLRTNDFSLVKEDFLSIIDFLQSFSSAYDLDKVEKFKHDFDDVMSEELKNHYDSRHMHHIECLIDGIVKARCLVEKDYSFVAKKEDYDVLESVWTEIVRSWINPEAIKNAPASKRINYLPANCKIVHNLIKEAGGSIHNAELKEASRKFMHQNEFYAAFVVLADNNIIIEEGSFIKVCV